MARRLIDLIRDDEIVARIGDDEFAILLPAVVTLSRAARTDTPSPLPQAVRRARHLVDSLAEPMAISGVQLRIEASVGVAVCRDGRTETGELLRQAGQALMEAKELRTGVAAYDSARDRSSTDSLTLLAELPAALATTDQIVLALQPAVDLETGAPTGVEALTRWRHPRRGDLSPADFIAQVESSELLAAFTRYVLDRSLEAAAAWAAAGLDLPISVNVSARSLLDPTLPSQVFDALRRHRVPAGRLVLEITETVAVRDETIVYGVLKALRESGVKISVDDFGTGFSTLSFVAMVPFDELKVDRSFVAAMTEKPAAAAVVRGAVELADRIGVRVVAEGVETAEQRAALLALGCTTAQGYHFCRPMPADKIVEALLSLAAGATTTKVVPLRADDAV